MIELEKRDVIKFEASEIIFWLFYLNIKRTTRDLIVAL